MRAMDQCWRGGGPSPESWARIKLKYIDLVDPDTTFSAEKWTASMPRELCLKWNGPSSACIKKKQSMQKNVLIEKNMFDSVQCPMQPSTWEDCSPRTEREHTTPSNATDYRLGRKGWENGGLGAGSHLASRPFETCCHLWPFEWRYAQNAITASWLENFQTPINSTKKKRSLSATRVHHSISESGIR